MIVLAYLPWLPVLLSQTRSVQVDYWINPLEPSEIAGMVCTWITGLAQPQQFEICLVGIFTCLATILAVRAYRVAAGILLALAVLPWLLAMSIGLIGGQPILVERYLVFAQFPALVLLATACVAVAGRWERSVVFAIIAIGIGSIGLDDVVLKSTDHQWVLSESANEVNRDYRSGDLNYIGPSRHAQSGPVLPAAMWLDGPEHVLPCSGWSTRRTHYPCFFHSDRRDDSRRQRLTGTGTKADLVDLRLLLFR